MASEDAPTPVPRRRLAKSTIMDSSGRYNPDDINCAVLIQSIWRRKLARRRFKAIIKRTYIVQEIYNTEKAYVESLRFVVEKYEKPLFERVAKGAPIVPEKELKALFFQIRGILICNIRLLDQLERRLKAWSAWQLIGDVFVDMSAAFESYTAFVNNYDIASMTLRKLEHNPQYQQFVSEIDQSGQRLKLNDYLIMPVQRIPRYELLLSQTLAHTSPFHPDFGNLKAAVVEIKRVADFINEKKRQAEAKAKVSEIESKMTGDFPPLVTDTRLFVRDADIVAVLDDTREMRRLFLFNDALLCATKIAPGSSHLVSKVLQSQKIEYEFEWMLPLLNITISNLKDPVIGNNYKQPSEIMEKIASLEKQLDIERHIERSAAKIAQIYKAENNRANKNEAKQTVGGAESKMEEIAKELKQQRELMRLYEPLVGLKLEVPAAKLSFVFVVRSESQREDWFRDILHWRKKELELIGMTEEELTSTHHKKKSSGGWSIRNFVDAVVPSINKKVVKGAQALSQVAGGPAPLYRSNSVNNAQSERRRYLKNTPGSPRNSMGSSAGDAARARHSIVKESSFVADSAPKMKPRQEEPPIKRTPTKSESKDPPAPKEMSKSTSASLDNLSTASVSQTSLSSASEPPHAAQPSTEEKKVSTTYYTLNSQEEHVTLKDSDSPKKNGTIKKRPTSTHEEATQLSRKASLSMATVLPSNPIVEFNPLVDTPFVADAEDNGETPSAVSTHQFATHTFMRPTRCDICFATISPHGREGLKCSECSFRCHRKCLKSVTTECTHTRDPLMDQMDDTADESQPFVVPIIAVQVLSGDDE